MAAGDFTASASNKPIIRLNELHRQPTMVQAEFSHPVMTAKTLMEKQSVQITPTLNGRECIGVKAWYMEAGFDATTYSGSVADATLVCDNGSGTQLQTNSQDYVNNVFINAKVAVPSFRCSNESEYIEEKAKALLKATTDIKRKLNNAHFLPLLTGNVQEDQWGAANRPALWEEASSGGNRLAVDPSLWNYDLLLELELLADFNEMEKGEYSIIDSTSLYVDKNVQEYRRLNDDGKDGNAIYNSHNIHWDHRNIESTLSRKSTFVVQNSVVCFWNTAWYSPTPELVDPSLNLYQYTIDDPELMWNNNGTMQRLQYHVEESFVCANRTSNQERVYNHVFLVTLIGGLYLAPTGFNKAGVPARELTGVLEIVNEVIV